jgi:hypothetical protein
LTFIVFICGAVDTNVGAIIIIKIIIIIIIIAL